MFSVSNDDPMGILQEGWSASVADYALAGDWTLDGEILVIGDAAAGIYAFDGMSGKSTWAFEQTHDGGLLAMAVHPSGTTFATAGQDGRILIWSAPEAEIKQVIEVGDGWVEKLAWSSDGLRLAASFSRRVYVYTTTGEKVWQSDNHPSTISAIAWSSTGELATACYGRVTFFDTVTGEVRQQLEWKGSLVSMVLSPCGDIVACGSQDRSVHFWRRSSGQDSMISGYPGKPTALAFDDSGTLLATGGGETVTVWSFQGSGPEGTRPGELELHVKPITALSFAKDSMHLASGGRDGGIVVWSLQKNGESGPIGAAFVASVIAGVCWHPGACRVRCTGRCYGLANRMAFLIFLAELSAFL